MIGKPLESFPDLSFRETFAPQARGKASMNKADDQPQAPRPEKASERVRLAEALRDNLRRRKAQTRARAATAEATVNSGPKPPAEA